MARTGVVELVDELEKFKVGADASVNVIVPRLPMASVLFTPSARIPDNFTKLVAEVILAAESLMATGFVSVLNAFVPV